MNKTASRSGKSSPSPSPDRTALSPATRLPASPSPSRLPQHKKFKGDPKGVGGVQQGGKIIRKNAVKTGARQGGGTGRWEGSTGGRSRSRQEAHDSSDEEEEGGRLQTPAKKPRRRSLSADLGGVSPGREDAANLFLGLGGGRSPGESSGGGDPFGFDPSSPPRNHPSASPSPPSSAGPAARTPVKPFPSILSPPKFKPGGQQNSKKCVCDFG
jgi:hypothetical protein